MDDTFGKWLADFDKEMVRRKRKVMLLDNCSVLHVNAHLSAAEVLFLAPNTTAKLQSMDQGIANFKVHYRRRVIERFLIDVRTADDNVANMKVPLVKAILFASGVWRDVKHLTIANCFEKDPFPGAAARMRRLPGTKLPQLTSLQQLMVPPRRPAWNSFGILLTGWTLCLWV